MKGETSLALKWADFAANAEKSFEQARRAQEFFDVTLVCEDSELEAHRLVISSGSEFFQNILRRTRHPHPLIYLKGIWRTELEAVVDFLYNGETRIPQSCLETFVNTAKELKVKGILNQDEDEETDTKKENQSKEPDADVIMNSSDGSFGPGYTTESVYNNEVKHNVSIWDKFDKIAPGNAVCKVCQKVLKTSDGSVSGLTKHMQSKHPDLIEADNQVLESNFYELEENQRKCNFCEKVVRGRNRAFKHLKKAHHGNLGSSEHSKGTPSLKEVKLEAIDETITPPKEVAETDGNAVDEVTGMEEKAEVAPAKTKSSAIWDRYESVSGEEARCNSCGEVLATKLGSTSGLWRHLHSVHPDTSPQALNTSTPPGIFHQKPPGLFSIWSRFDRFGNGEAACKICQTVLKTTDGNTTGLKRHMQSKHMDLAEADSLVVEEHFEEAQEGGRRCLACAKVITGRNRALKHLELEHRDIAARYRQTQATS